MSGNIIEEYLVKLGMEGDRETLNAFNRLLGDMDKAMASASSGWAKGFLSATTVITGAIATVNIAIGTLIAKTAQQDLQMEIMARNMMMSKQAAWEMKTATDALGQSLQNIAMTPELREQYKLLVGDARRMMPGSEFSGQAKQMRELIFEFTRLKQEASYSLNWIGFHLMKSLSVPLKQVREQMKGFNEYIISNMPQITAQIAKGFLYLIDIGKNVVTAFKDIGKAIGKLWDSFPEGAKIAIAAITSIFAVLKIFKAHPFMLAISALILLIDDFYGHLEGKESLLGGLWDTLIEGAKKAKPIYDSFVKKIGEFLSVLKELGYTVLGMVKEGLEDIFKEMEKQELFETLNETISSIGEGVTDLIKGLNEFLKILQKSEIARAFWDSFKEGVVRAVKAVYEIGGALGHLISALGYLIRGEFSKAAAEAGKFVMGTGSAIGNFIVGGVKNNVKLAGQVASALGLGSLSEEYESGGNSAAYGWDSTGGNSWGRYQIAEGTMPSFLKYLDSAAPDIAQALRAAGGNGDSNSAFGQKWKELVAADPQGFSALEHGFIKQSHYDPAAQDILSRTGVDINSRSKSLQDVLWSTAVQHGSAYDGGGASRIFYRAIEALGKDASDEELMKYIYKIRGEYFSNSTADEKSSVINRFNQELENALAMLRSEQASKEISSRLGNFNTTFMDAQKDWLAPYYNAGANLNSNTTLNVGDININVAGTNATAGQIGDAVSQGIQGIANRSRAKGLALSRAGSTPIA